MKIQVVVTRTDAGATTKLMSNGGESSKNYASWNDALKEAEDLTAQISLTRGLGRPLVKAPATEAWVRISTVGVHLGW
jgi:hypothetical protein